MKSELRIGRRVGVGATINLTTAAQVVGGLSCTLKVPKGHIALVTGAMVLNVNNSSAYGSLEVNGATVTPGIAVSGTPQSLQAAQTWQLPPGRHALRMLVASSAAVGTMDPPYATLSWIIAPQGGQV